MGEPDGEVRMSLQTLEVLEAFLEIPTAELAGLVLDMCRYQSEHVARITSQMVAGAGC